MTMKLNLSAHPLVALVCVLAPVAALAQGSPSVTLGIAPVPLVQQINQTDLFQDVTGPSAGNVYAPAPLLGNYPATQNGNNPDTLLIGAEFDTNLFQRATTATQATPANVAYVAPDRWFSWGGTNTPVTLSKQTASGHVAPGFTASLQVNKASGAGTAQVCIAQEVESMNAVRLQGQTVEFDVLAQAGPTFSAVGNNLALYILTGTGTDEGSVNAAFTINAGGGGSTAWTGATRFGGATGFLVPLVAGSFNKVSAAATLPQNLNEVAVAMCWTPTGTGSSTDYFEVSAAQLSINTALTAAAGATGALLVNPLSQSPYNDPRTKSFSRRLAGVESLQQERYAYAINEGTITAGALMAGGGNATAATTMQFAIPFPATMRVAPTYTNSLTATTFKMSCGGVAAAALATPFSATAGANTPYNASITFTSSGATAGFACELVSAAGSGQMLFSAEL
jgi:hypothetical protein